MGHRVEPMFEQATATVGDTTAGDGDAGSNARIAILAAVLLVTVPLAGCAGGGGPSNGADGGQAAGEAFKAKDERATAEQIAQEWSSDATLIGASTIETGEQPDQWSQQGFEFIPDGAIGDGLAPQWVYFFEDGKGDKLGVGVNANGDTYQNTEADPQSPGGPIESWSVNSVDAVDAAKENETFSSILEEDDAEVLYFLAGGESSQDAPQWLLRASSDAAGEEQTVIVDAETGETRTFGR